MLAAVQTFAIDALEPHPVVVEADLRQGLPAFTIVGLADRAVRESRERVAAAVRNSGLDWPDRRVTVNLAPAALRKAGPGFDLAIAGALLAASGQVPATALDGTAVFGELGLDGSLRPCRGALAVAEGCVRSGVRRLVVPVRRAPEAALVEGLDVLGCESLREVADVLRGEAGAVRTARDAAEAQAPPTAAPAVPDLADVRGHPEVVAALVLAAAGGHNLLLSGPPGVGKTMLARRMPGILPPLTRAEALEVTRIHSVAGLHDRPGLVAARPFRAPHHQISASGLVGGGATPTPGEASLAHHGVLFLDELSEFNRAALDALRQPLEDGHVVIVRGQRATLMPTRCTLVAATNPCPCGWHGTPRCRCTEADHARHARRLSGPLLDRLDIVVAVNRPAAEALSGAAGTTTAEARERVMAARERQQHRLAGTDASCNGHLDSRGLREHLHLEDGADRDLVLAYAAGGLSARGRDRILRVARTAADLDGAERVGRDHVMAAIGRRSPAEQVRDIASPALAPAGGGGA